MAAWPVRTTPRDPGRNRLLLACSSVALSLAAIVVVTLHELAHAVAGLSLGVGAVLHPNSVSYVPELPPGGQVVTAAAGPVFSLVLGAVVFLVGRNLAGGFVRLLLLWTGLASMQNFAGYLLIAPVARVGDSGKVLALLDAPGAAYAVSVVLGVALTLLNARLLAGQVTRYARSQDELRHLVLLPWLVGTGVTVALTLLDTWISGLGADDVVVVLAGGVAVAIFAPMFTFFYGRLHPAYEHLTLRTPVVPLVVTVVLAVLVAVVLGPGLRLE
ncbi:zinc metalloprotease [Microlunatus antarcticus]|uniref:Uncharacterized protein n=1 Tax=Microlunatus antarcticus TaxID=53388 RepID=A0A7W5JZ66_9ACTN|nr:hypothetical protein [Microlunatus antarcticus]MBB3329037.1 hypothetical protein [Microlunatus antarcticus]